jgi:hypothetical protein
MRTAGTSQVRPRAVSYGIRTVYCDPATIAAYASPLLGAAGKVPQARATLPNSPPSRVGRVGRVGRRTARRRPPRATIVLSRVVIPRAAPPRHDHLRRVRTRGQGCFSAAGTGHLVACRVRVPEQRSCLLQVPRHDPISRRRAGWLTWQSWHTWQTYRPAPHALGPMSARQVVRVFFASGTVHPHSAKVNSANHAPGRCATWSATVPAPSRK